MRYLKFPLFFLIVLGLNGCCIFGDCEDDGFENDPLAFSQYEPVYLDRGILEQSVRLMEPIPILNSGKIYIKDNLLFVGEARKGFHVFDNTNPENPVKIKFIEVPGSTDLAIRNNVLYVNQATDLIAARFNVASNELSVTKRVENMFPELLSPDGYYANDLPDNSVVVDWKLKD